MRQTKSQLLRLLFFLLLWLLAGCAPRSRYVWQHPAGFSEAERQLAIEQCEQLAADEVRQYDYYDPFPYYYDRYYYRDRYLFLPHYLHYNSQREFNDLRRFFRICMKSKGWRLTRLQAAPPAR